MKSTFLLATALGLSQLAAPALADSSSALSASSTSVGSASTSVEKSSDSSSGKKRVAQGQYTIVEMAALVQQPDTLRLRLKALTPGATTELTLLLPRQAIESAQLESGQTISAQQRPYGLALATLTPAGAMGPFFLLLDDDWYRELESRPVAIDHASEA